MTEERQRQLLVGLLVGLILVIGWRSLRPMLGGGSSALTEGGGSAGAIGMALQEVERVRLSDLDRDAAEFKLGRDPFGFFTPPQPSKPAETKPAPKKPPAPRPRPAPAQPARNTQGPVAQPPPVDVVYLGRFGSNDRPIAVFSDGNEIFNVLEGGVLKKHFVVDKIGYESADLKFVDFPDTPSKRLAVGG